MIGRVNQWVERLFDLAVNRTPARDERERRSRSVVRGTVSAVLARGLGSLTGIITVPLTVRYLGAERYGVWMTISSVLMFLSFTDFGLASSLTNALGKAFGEDDRDRARRYVSTTLFFLSAIAVLLVVAGIIFAGPVATFLFQNVEPTLLHREIIPALIIALAIFALNFPLLVANRVLAAYQESALANIWIMIGSIANLLGILAVVWFRGGLPLLVLGSSGLGLVVNAISGAWLFGWHKPWLRPAISGIDRQFVNDLFSTSWKFFIGSAAWIINLQTGNLIIAHYLGPAQVTPYSVTFRLFAYATLIQGLALPSLWPAITEAAARKDFDWIRGIFQKNLKWSFLIAIGFVGILTIFGQTIIRVWAGEVAVPPFSVILWMAIWNLMLAHLYVAGCLLNATGHITGISIYGTVTAILNIVLSIWLVRIYGITGVIAATVMAYLIASYIPTLLETRSVLRKLSRPAVG